MTVALMLDLVIAGLLSGTIVYAVILNRRLAGLRRDKEEIARLIVDFNAAAEQARAGTVALREMADGTAGHLNGIIEDGRALRDDLGFLLERGGALADRIDGSLSAARAGPQAKGNAGAQSATRHNPDRESPKGKQAAFGPSLAAAAGAEKPRVVSEDTARTPTSESPSSRRPQNDDAEAVLRRVLAATK